MDGVTVERRGNDLLIRIPMAFKRRGGRKEIHLPHPSTPENPRNAAPQEPLATALARAFHWQGLLDAGKYASIEDLALSLGVDRSYAARVIRLTLLAPDIVEAILFGREPSGLSLERLVKKMPVVWGEQRTILVDVS